MARKRDEKQRKKKQKELKHVADTVACMNIQLAAYGLMLREVPGDGNCLFRALGDQLEGHMSNHLKFRLETCQFMREHRTDFEPFVEDDVSFEKHVYDLEQPGTYAGNDAIVAFARYQGAIVVIHQLNAPLWQVHGLTVTEHQSVRELHIAYHNGDHYDSVRRVGDYTEAASAIKLLGIQPYNTIGKSKTEVSYPPLRLEDLTDMERTVMDQSGCDDFALISQALQDNEFDVPSAVQYINNLKVVNNRLGLGDGDDKSWSSEDLTWSHGEEVTPKAQSQTPKQTKKQHISNKKRKELQKQERKRQSDERKKKSSPQNTSSIVSQVEALSI